MKTIPIENNFLQSLCQMSETACLPCALLDREFHPLWCSSAAAVRWPLLATAQGTSGILSGLASEQVRKEISALGFFRTPDNSDNPFLSGSVTFLAAPKECGDYYFMQPSVGQAAGSGLRPTGLQRSISSFEANYRSPLSLIFSNVSVTSRSMKQKGIFEEYQPALESIQQCSLQLLRSVQMIMEYTRLSNDLLPLYPERLDLLHFLREIFFAAASLIAPIGIPFSYTVPDGPLPAVTDVSRVTSVLLNLLSNACRFTRPENRIEISVQQKNDRLLIRISDQGVGMPPDVCQRAFEPYYSHSPDGAPFAGNGLGLAIAQHSAAVIGGSLALTSIPDESTCATFSFPTHLPHQPTDRIGLRSDPPEYLKDRYSVLRVMLADCLRPDI